MSLTPADIKKVDVQSIRDVASALEKQGTSLNDIKNAFPNLPHVGNWTGIAATAGNDGLSTLGGYMGGHGDGRLAAAKKMQQAADEFQNAKDKLAKVENEAGNKFSIDYATGAVTPTTDSAADKNLAVELAAGIKSAVADGDAADADLTHAVNLADGTEKPAEPLGGIPSVFGYLDANKDRVLSQQENQELAFREVFNRAPTTPADWQTAEMLDPHNYDPKYKGAQSEITVAKIEPQPGKGVVQMNAFIPGKEVWNLGGNDLGDNRGFNSKAAASQSRGNILIDFNNGLVVARDNPSVDAATGQTAVHKPDVSVIQGKDGAVNVQWRMADGFMPGGTTTGGLTMHNVGGELVIQPTESGFNYGGNITEFPAYEAYANGKPLFSNMPLLGHNPAGPALELMGYRDIGNPDLIKPFHVQQVQVLPLFPGGGDTRIPGTELVPVGPDIPTARVK